MMSQRTNDTERPVNLGVGVNSCHNLMLVVLIVASIMTSQLLTSSRASAAPHHSLDPVIGRVFATGVAGFGTSRPVAIALGWNATSLITHIQWRSWGGAEAIGTALAEFTPPNQPESNSRLEPATVVAFNLGKCAGRYAYTSFEEYFPGEKQHFSALNYMDACYGGAVYAENIRSGSCNLISLVSAADDYEIAHANIDGSTLPVDAFACTSGYGDLIFNSGGWSNEMLLKESTVTKKWGVLLIRGAQVSQPATPDVPERIYRQLSAVIAHFNGTSTQPLGYI